jgi:para-nitrobenzyl esterase
MSVQRVEIAQGVLEGIGEDGHYRFLGIPYAAPPVGPLRWHAPLMPDGWTGVRDATLFSPIAIQTVGGGPSIQAASQSEDCLYLNVWTDRPDPATKQPVMVWIHGGGNLGGSGSEDWYDGAALARRGVTVVTFNYRLGAFGFLAHPAVGANFAVLDYVAALEWVKANIAAFGGDPDNVTIFGQSAGAVAVRTLLSCPQARGLFHRAIIMSAGFERFSFAPGWSWERASAAGEALFEQLGTSDIEALRRLPAETLKLASHDLSGIFPKPGHVHTPANLVWMPVPDGTIVFDDGFPGWPEDVPVMFGCVENEARYFIRPGGDYSWELVEAMAKALAGPRAGDVLALLRDETEDPYVALDRLFSGVIWIEPALATAKRFAAIGRRFHYYHFARASPGARASNELVKHSAELRYVFGTLTQDGAYDATDATISGEMMSAWTAFARDGNPRRPDGSAWPRYPEMTFVADRVETRPFAVSPLTAIIHSLRDR